MYWTTHVTAGAALGYLIGRPLPAAVAGVAGHVLMDVAPHHDPEEHVGYVVDSAIGLAFVSALALAPGVRGSKAGRAAIWGAVGAGLPDTELLAKLFVMVRPEQYIFPTHNYMLPHSEAEKRASTVSQVTLVGLLVLADLWKWLRVGAGPGGRAGLS